MKKKVFLFFFIFIAVIFIHDLGWGAGILNR